MSLEIISGISQENIQLKQPQHNQPSEARKAASVTASGKSWEREQPGDFKVKRHKNLKYIKYFIRRMTKNLTGTKEKRLTLIQDEKDFQENSNILEDNAEGNTKVNFPDCKKLSASEENEKYNVEENFIEEQKLIVPGKHYRKKRMKRILLHLANVHARKLGKTLVCNNAGDDVLVLGEFSEKTEATEERAGFLDVAGNINVSDEDAREICCETRTGEEGKDEAGNKYVTRAETLNGASKDPADSVKIGGGAQREDTENERVAINEGEENKITRGVDGGGIVSDGVSSCRVGKVSRGE